MYVIDGITSSDDLKGLNRLKPDSLLSFITLEIVDFPVPFIPYLIFNFPSCISKLHSLILLQFSIFIFILLLLMQKRRNTKL